jgi:hypothetical protein
MKYKLIKLASKHKLYGTGVNYQIKALKDFADVRIGDLGGYVNHEHNLSQKGNCWLYDNTKMYGNSEMFNNARMYNNSEIHDNAVMYGNSIMHDNAKMFNNAIMYDSTTMYSNTKMYDNSEMWDNAKIYGNATMLNNARMLDNSEMWDDSKLKTSLYGILFGDIELKRQKDIKVISHIGRSNLKLTLIRYKGIIYASKKYFKGTLKELIEKDKKENNKHYDNIEEIAKLLFKF